MFMYIQSSNNGRILINLNQITFIQKIGGGYMVKVSNATQTINISDSEYERIIGYIKAANKLL